MRQPFILMTAALAILAISTSARLCAMETGDYAGVSEGGELFLSVQNDNLDIAIGVPGCAGEGKGKLVRTGEGRWTATLTDSDASCTLDIQQQGNRFNVLEHDCSYFHGFSCRFDGFVTKN